MLQSIPPATTLPTIPKLLYKASTDGDTKNIFHNKCDNQGPTVSIIGSKDGHIFGGYASQSWDKNTHFISDVNSFLFKEYIGNITYPNPEQ